MAKIRIGFDLDGVIVGKPTFVPKKVLEILVRSPASKRLKYRFPHSKIEQKIRQISHLPLFRPPMGKNIETIKSLMKIKNVSLYVISSRYSFLQNQTWRWLTKNGLNGIFRQVYLNKRNQQPHLFKEHIIKKLKLDYYFEDDQSIADYLEKKIPATTLCPVLGDNDVAKGLPAEISAKKKVLKTLFLLTYYYPHWTGLTAYAQRIAEGLCHRGHRALVITSCHDPHLPGFETYRHVKIYRVKPLLRVSRSMVSPGIFLKMIQLRKKYTSVSIHLPYPDVLPAVILARILGKKVYLTHNGDLVLPAGFINRILEFVYYVTSYLATCFANGIVVQTRDYARHSPLLSRLFKKTYFVYAPVRIPSPRDEQVDRWKKELGLAHHKLIGIAGRFVEEKGFDYFLRAIPRVVKFIPNAAFLFAGDTNIRYENFYQRCSPLIKKNKKYIRFLGLIKSKQQMANFYRLLDVFVISSRTDCFPSTQIEAVLNGTPVVCTDIPGAREIVKKTGMGLLARPYSSSSLAEKVVEVIKKRSHFISHWPKARSVFNYQKSLRWYEKIFGC